MKKTTILGAAAAVLAVAGMASCDGAKSDKGHHDQDKVEVYTGVLPAADADGVRYDLRLDYDDDHNFTDGDYDLRETYLTADSTATSGYTDGKSFLSEGDFTVNKQDGKTYLKLVQDLKDSQAGSNVGPMYFLVESDSTLVLVNDQLRKADNPDMNYTLRLSR